jgi:CheY-like chemotaxis protein
MGRILVVDDDALIRRKVVQLLQTAGHQVESAENGQQGLSKIQNHDPELVVVDFVMPKMNGYQFCAALRSLPNHKDTPVILLSARSTEVGQRFAKRFGVSDAISKPFDPDVLLTVIQNVLNAKPTQAITQSSDPPFEMEFPPKGESVEVDPLPKATEQIALFLTERISTLRDKKEEIITAISDGFRTNGSLRSNKLIADMIAAFLGFSLSGDTTHIPLHDVLQMLDMQHQTGLLEITLERLTVTVQLRNGKVEMALSNKIRPEFLLGRYLVQEQLITQQDLNMLLKNRVGNRLLGQQLIKLGYIDGEELAKVLGLQTTDLLIETMGRNHGTFLFYPGREMPGAMSIGNQFSLANLVMEQLRQVDKWNIMEEAIPNFEVVFKNTGHRAMFDPTKLYNEETLVLNEVDGSKSVRDIIETMDMDSFAVCKILYRLILIKLINPMTD